MGGPARPPKVLKQAIDLDFSGIDAGVIWALWAQSVKTVRNEYEFPGPLGGEGQRIRNSVENISRSTSKPILSVFSALFWTIWAPELILDFLLAAGKLFIFATEEGLTGSLSGGAAVRTLVNFWGVRSRRT